MSVLAVITARGGSKRIPGKNIKNFCGKPMIAYSIEAAKNSGIFDIIMVSTDSKEIAETAKSFGVEVPFFRSQKNSGDFASTADVLTEVIDAYQRDGKEFDYLACIYPTAPFLTGEKMKLAFEMLKASGADSLIPVVRFGYPPQRGFLVESSHVRYQYPENRFARSQDLQPIYHDCGQFYFCRVKPFIKSHDLVMENTIPMMMDEREVQDIDSVSDWEMAEMKYKIWVKNREK